MNPDIEIVPLYLNTLTYYNNQKLDRISFDIIECDTLFTIIINNKAIMLDVPKTKYTIKQLDEYKDLLFALKTTMLIINAEIFGTKRENNVRIIVRIENYDTNDMGIGIKVLEGDIESLSGVVRIADKEIK